MQHLDNEANRLVAKQPSSRDLIDEKQAEIIDNWEQLTQRADERKQNLEQSKELQKFLANLRDLVRLVFGRLTSYSASHNIVWVGLVHILQIVCNYGMCYYKMWVGLDKLIV